MTLADLLVDAFTRIRDSARAAVEGLDAEQLARRPAPQTNPIGWLVWHLARIQDDHVADLAGRAQVWTEHGWHGRFGLPLEPRDTGYGHTPQAVAALSGATAEQLTGYLGAVHAQTVDYVSSISERDLGRVVDTRWDPPVTLGVRLVSVLADDLQHVGQAAYVRGLLLAQPG